MNAQEMVQFVRECELELQREITRAVFEKLRKVVEGTGLEISRVTIALVDVTQIGSKCQELAIGDVTIHAELPAPVEGA